MPGPAITTATQDDWIVTFQMRSPRTGKAYTRRIGVNGYVNEAEAVRLATATIEPPRAKLEGRTHKVLGFSVCRFHQWSMQQQAKYQVLDTMKV